jgi:hypothetical protein
MIISAGLDEHLLLFVEFLPPVTASVLHARYQVVNKAVRWFN